MIVPLFEFFYNFELSYDSQSLCLILSYLSYRGNYGKSNISYVVCLYMWYVDFWNRRSYVSLRTSSLVYSDIPDDKDCKVRYLTGALSKYSSIISYMFYVVPLSH